MHFTVWILLTVFWKPIKNFIRNRGSFQEKSYTVNVVTYVLLKHVAAFWSYYLSCSWANFIQYDFNQKFNFNMSIKVIYKYLSSQILHFWLTYVVYDYLFIDGSAIEHVAISYIVVRSLAKTWNGMEILRFYYCKIKPRFYTFSKFR